MRKCLDFLYYCTRLYIKQIRDAGWRPSRLDEDISPIYIVIAWLIIPWIIIVLMLLRTIGGIKLPNDFLYLFLIGLCILCSYPYRNISSSYFKRLDRQFKKDKYFVIKKRIVLVLYIITFPILIWVAFAQF